MYHLISIMFFLMTRTVPVQRRYRTQKGPVIVSYIWKMTVHSDANFMSFSSNGNEVLTQEEKNNKMSNKHWGRDGFVSA